MLFQPEAHEPLVAEPWNEERVRSAIREMVADAEDAFDEGWPSHPRDADEPRRFHSVYLGAAGVIDALARLERRGLVELSRDYAPFLERTLAADPDFPDYDPQRSLWMGETGIRLVLQRLAPSAENAGRLAELIAANMRDERCELMWGSPGTMLAARELGLADLWRGSAEWLHDRWDAETGLWTQHLYGRVEQFIGPAHGFAGCVLALAAEPNEQLHRRAADTTRRTAFEEDGLANWPPRVSADGLRGGDGEIRVQWCHGAPGMVASLARLAPDDDEHTRLLLAGGELTWRAGPLRKGPNLCHGTAGNGYAFLALLARTGDELWLTRARAFAMHAIEQVERERRQAGRGRYTLWTGDPGAALYLSDCLDGAGDLPLP